MYATTLLWQSATATALTPLGRCGKWTAVNATCRSAKPTFRKGIPSQQGRHDLYRVEIYTGIAYCGMFLVNLSDRSAKDLKKKTPL